MRVRTERNFLKNFITSILIMIIVAMITIVVLIMVQHPLVAQDGMLYMLLYGERNETVHTAAQLPDEPDIYEMQYIQRLSPPMVQIVSPLTMYRSLSPYTDADDAIGLPFYIPDDTYIYEQFYSEPYAYESLYPESHAYEPLYPEAYAYPEDFSYYSPVPYADTGGTIFSEFSFHIPENTYIYEQFQQNRPYLSPEEVVWKVNAHLHLPFFYNINLIDDPNPLLVNPFYRLPPGFTPGELVPVNNANCSLRATPQTVEAFRTMRTSAREYGVELRVVSAFRTARRQAELFSRRNYVDGVVARPYHSEHQTGRALDLGGPGGGLLDARGSSRAGRWVAENAHVYGFILRYRAETTHITGYIHEPWHITYVGVGISMYMYENRILSLEEFVGRNPGVGL